MRSTPSAIARPSCARRRFCRMQRADEAAILDLLVTEREERTGRGPPPANPVHALLHQLDPHYRRQIPSLITAVGLAALEQYQTGSGHPLDQARAASVRRLGQRLWLAVGGPANWPARSSSAPPRAFPLMGARGEGADCRRPARHSSASGGCASEYGLAAYAGVAPLEASSGGATRHRLNRGGTVGLNAILYRIALTQARSSPDGENHRPAAHGRGRNLAGGDQGPQALPGPRHLAAVAGMPAAPGRPHQPPPPGPPGWSERPRRRRTCSSDRRSPAGDV